MQVIAGVDEAGRGPLAGPVCVAAVILDPSRNIQGLNDSKKLTAARRDVLFDEILEHALESHIVAIDPARIDSLNILQATMLGMKLSIEGLRNVPTLALIDGNRVPKELAIPARAIIGGDALEPAIMAASILAKVTRDRLMQKAALTYPAYGFETHKGYPTRAHVAALMEHGPCPLHRRSFGPVKKALTVKTAVSTAELVL